MCFSHGTVDWTLIRQHMPRQLFVALWYLAVTTQHEVKEFNHTSRTGNTIADMPFER